MMSVYLHPFLVIDALAPEHDGKAFGRVWRHWEEADQLSVTNAQTISQRGRPAVLLTIVRKSFPGEKREMVSEKEVKLQREVMLSSFLLLSIFKSCSAQ